GQCPVGGDETTAEGGAMDRGDLVGQRDQVPVGVFDRHVLGERAPGGEAGGEVEVADVGQALPAGPAAATTDGEGDGDPVADPPPAHPGADRGGGADHLVAGHVREGGVGVVAGPAVVVAVTDAGGLHPRHATGRAGHGIGSL